MTKEERAIQKALDQLKELGIKVNSYTVYPAKGALKVNLAIEATGKKEGKKKS